MGLRTLETGVGTLVSVSVITQARTYRYNIMCSLVAHDRLQENKSSIGDREIPNDATLKQLKSLGATFNFIDTTYLLGN